MPGIRRRTCVTAVACAVLATSAVARAQPLDTSFNPGANDGVVALAVQADGKILVGGHFYMLGGGGTGTTTRNYVGRLNADGSLDTSFDPGANGTVSALAVQADGKILVGGAFTTLGGGGAGTTPRYHIGRLNADGSLDTSFDPGANDGVYALAVQADGKILVGGGFTTLGGGSTGTTTRNYVGRLNADGSLDTTFDPGANGGVLALAVQANGKILVGGSFHMLGGGSGTTPRYHIGRLQGDGSLDTGFDPGASNSVFTLAVQADGQILVGGSFRMLGGGATGTTPRNMLGRLHADGSLDTSFDPGARDIVWAVAVQTDGKILVGGWFQGLGGGSDGRTTRNYIGRLNADGSLDASFNPGSNSNVHAVAVQANGQILVGGFFTALGGGVGTTPRNRIGRLNADGSLDTRFDPGANNSVTALAVQADGQILVGGAFTTLGGGGTGSTPRNYLGRLHADGFLDTSFDPGANAGLRVLAVQTDGRILVGGWFTTLGGGGTGTTPRNYLGRLNADGSLDTSFDPGANGYVYALVLQADGQILVAGFFTALGGGTGSTARNHIGRLNADGSLDTSFDPGASSDVYALAVEADGQILVGGAFTTLGGGGTGTTPRNRIGRINTDGSLDTSFNPGANGYVSAFAVQADRQVLVGGGFTTLGGGGAGTTMRNRIARLHTDGSLDMTFDPGANDQVYALAIQADGAILVGGSFTALGGGTGTTPRNHIGRLWLGGVPTIDWANPASIVYGTALSTTQLNATADVPGTFVYTPAAGTILDFSHVDERLSVTFTPTDTNNYTAAIKTVRISVTKATPVITWATPASLVYGTALSTTQLNATANVPGAFVYTPAAGTVLAAGTHTLSTTFTPTDTWNYVSVAQTVVLEVTAPAALPVPTLVSPTGAATVATAQPTYQWSAVAGAEEYYLWVSSGGQVRIGQWFTAAAAGCGGGTGICAVTPATALANGDVRWAVKAWSTALGHGPWSADGWFTVASSAPMLLSPSNNATVTTAQPTYQWGAVAGAEEYYLWVYSVHQVRIGQWVTAAAAGCGSGTGTCAVTPATALSNGAGVQWKVKAWSAEVGHGPWSAVSYFRLSWPFLSRPTLVLPLHNTTVTTTTPTYQWGAVAGAEEYHLWVSTGGQVRIGQWVTAAAAGCGGGAGTCAVTPATALTNGHVRWEVKAWSTALGEGPWSADGWFTVAVSLPAAPTLASPTGWATVTTAQLTYQWSAVAGAEEYYLWVSSGGQVRIGEWFTAAAAGCGDGTGTCAVTPTTALANGDVRWAVKAWSAALGHGPWSADGWFTVASSTPAALAAPTLVSPTGSVTVTTPQPAYQWGPVAGAEEYYLWVSSGGQVRIGQWVTAAAAGCGSGTGTCAVRPATALANDTVRWGVKAWSTALGHGPWSADGWFTVAASTPAALAAPTLVSPTGSVTVTTPQPAYQWGAVAGAEEYYLWVSSGSQVRIGEWVTAAAAGCGGGTGTCAVTPATALANGDVRWAVKAWSTALGHGPWSADGWFTVTGSTGTGQVRVVYVMPQDRTLRPD